MTHLLTDYVTFNSRRLAARYADGRIPISTLYEAYFDGDIDIPGDIYALLRDRDLFVKYTLTPKHLKWAVTNFVPEVAIHSKAQDERIVREPKLLLPFLKSFYEVVVPLAWPVARFARVIPT